jgi:hypothetical protein
VAGNRKLLAEMVWPHFWAIQNILLVLIVMYCTMHELVRVIGREKGAADILRPDACPASLSEALMAEGRGEEEIDGFFSRSLSRSRRVFSAL